MENNTPPVFSTLPSQRPWIISVIAVFAFILGGYVLWIVYAAGFRVDFIWNICFSLFLAAALFSTSIGLWKMRKWAVYIFIILNMLVAAIALFLPLFAVGLSSGSERNWLLFFLFIIGLLMMTPSALLYRKRSLLT